MTTEKQRFILKYLQTVESATMDKINANTPDWIIVTAPILVKMQREHLIERIKAGHFRIKKKAEASNQSALF